MPKYKKYPSMVEAIQKIQAGETIHSVSNYYGIPKTTLFRRLRVSEPDDVYSGAPTTLSRLQEQQLVAWIETTTKKGFSITKDKLLDSVEMFIASEKILNNFKNGRPGRRWFDCFLRRNPEIIPKISQKNWIPDITLTVEDIHNWFHETQNFLAVNNSIDILLDPSRIFNCAEIFLSLLPNEDVIDAKKRRKTKTNSDENEKNDWLTVLLMCSANASIAPPMITFPNKKFSSKVHEKIPSGCRLRGCDSGWMDGGSFYEYVVGIFYLWLMKKKIQFPIILFMDYHKSHLTMALSKFCNQNKIFLIPLPPNTIHIMQPLEIGVFKPLKIAFKDGLFDWHLSHIGDKLKEEDFPPMLKSIISRPITRQNIKNGFCNSGLHPFNVNLIKYDIFSLASSSLSSANNFQFNNTPISTLKISRSQNFFELFEEEIGYQKIQEFESKFFCVEWTGCEKDENLFYIWRSMKNKFSPHLSFTNEYDNKNESDNESESESENDEKINLILANTWQCNIKP